ncbi:MAG: methyltransferase domain-containing protein [Pseudobacteriovorax sp.]|nr:methyltransferase domain-containing protein [Pseudobacteriovorax sp.]
MAINHYLEWDNPLGFNKLMRSIDLIPLQKGQKVIDFGSGNGRIPLLISEKYGTHSTLNELDSATLVNAKNLFESKGFENRVEYLEGEAEAQLGHLNNMNKLSTFDLAMCLGSTHVFGGYAKTLAALKQCCKPNGYVMIADAFWKRPPPKELRDQFWNAPEDDLITDHNTNIENGVSADLVPLYATVASDDDYNDYEWLNNLPVVSQLADRFPEKEAVEKYKKVTYWLNGYNRLGRDYVGFGLYLFKNSSLRKS